MDRNAAIMRVVKLSERTEENGCTPGEVAAAEARAQKIIHRYGLTLGEVESAAMIEEMRRRPRPRAQPMPRQPVPMPMTGVSPTGGSGQFTMPSGGYAIWIRFG